MFLAALMAVIMIMPVIYWNYNHDFISFRYQSGHVFGTLAASAKNFIASIAAQFGAYSPFLFLVAFYGFFRSLHSRNDYVRLSILFGGVIILFFFFTSLAERTLPHWPSIFYLLFIPIGTYEILISDSRWKKNFLYIGIGVSLVLMLFAYVEVAGKFFTFPDYKSPFRDIYGFSTIAKDADQILKKSKAEKKAIAVTNWTMGSRTMYYSLPYHDEVFVIDQRKDQFDVWQKNEPLGYDLLFINTYFHELNIDKYVRCASVENAGKADIILHEGKVDSIEYIWCHNYQGVKF
jgi:hypothetical protein